jgi:hypothetical protein
MPQPVYPGGIKEISRGLIPRSGSHPRLSSQIASTPGGVEESSLDDRLGHGRFYDPSRVGPISREIPGVVASLDPRLMSGNPSGMLKPRRSGRIPAVTSRLMSGNPFGMLKRQRRVDYQQLPNGSKRWR